MASLITDEGCCKNCGDDIEVAHATVMATIPPSRDPEGKCRIEIRLECATCGADLRAFLPAAAFHDADDEGADDEN